jgi:hypothetical protein
MYNIIYSPLPLSGEHRHSLRPKWTVRCLPVNKRVLQHFVTLVLRPFRQRYSIPYHPNQKSSRCKDERHCHLHFGVIDGGYRSDWIVSDVCKWNTVESGLDYSFSDYRWVKVQARVTLWLSLTYQHNFGRMLGWMSYVGIMRTSLPLFLRRHQQPYLFASGWF